MRRNKVRAAGTGFTIPRWIGNSSLIFCRKNNEEIGRSVPFNPIE